MALITPKSDVLLKTNEFLTTLPYIIQLFFIKILIIFKLNKLINEFNKLIIVLT